MQNKEWLLIIMSVILLVGLVTFLFYQNTAEKYSKIGSEKGYVLGYDGGYDEGYDEGYRDKICKDNYKEDYREGYDDGVEDGEQRVISCVKECYYEYSFGGSRLLICLRACGIENAILLYTK